CPRSFSQHLAIPPAPHALNVVPDKQRPPACAQTVNLSGFESLPSSAAFQMRDGGLSFDYVRHDSTPFGTPSNTGSGNNSIPNRSRTRPRISRARRTTSSAFAPPLLTRASVCFVDKPTGP